MPSDPVPLVKLTLGPAPVAYIKGKIQFLYPEAEVYFAESVDVALAAKDETIAALRQKSEEFEGALVQRQQDYVNTRESLRAQLGGAERRAERAESALAAMRPQLADAQQTIKEWREWAQFAYLGGGRLPEGATDTDLRDRVYQSQNQEAATLRAEVGVLRARLAHREQP